MAWDTAWEKIFSSREWGKYPAEDLIRSFARNFYKAPDRSAIKILEVGCGPGPNLWYLAREGFSVYGIDGSPTGIEIARKRLDQECAGWKGELKTGDMANLPFPDNFFDCVFDSEAIYSNNYEDARKIYLEMWRVAKPGGKMLSITFANGSWMGSDPEKLAHNEYIIKEGPLQGSRVTRLTDLEQISALVEPWKVLEVNERNRSVGGVENGHFVREWIIEAEKN